MCWCNPSLRAPCCGKPGCHPPREEGPTFTELRTVLRALENDVRTRIQFLETKFGVRVYDLNVYRDDNGLVESVRADVRL